MLVYFSSQCDVKLPNQSSPVFVYSFNPGDARSISGVCPWMDGG